MSSNSALGGDATVSGGDAAKAIEDVRGVHTDPLEPLRVAPGQNYAAQYFSSTAKDDRMRLQAQLAQGNPFGQVQAGPEVIDYIEQKRKEDLDRRYDQWYLSNFSLQDPSQLEMARKYNPKVFDRIVKTGMSYFDIAKRVYMINVMGPRSEDDYKLKWLYDTGRINAPPPEFWNPLSDAQTSGNPRYQPGIFNPRRRQTRVPNPDPTESNGILGARPAPAAFGAAPGPVPGGPTPFGQALTSFVFN